MEQILPPAVENSLEKWAQNMDDHGPAHRLGILEAMARGLAEQKYRAEGDHRLAKLGKTRLQRLLNRHPEAP